MLVSGSYHCTVVKAVEVMLFTFCYASFFILVCTTIDRHIHVTKPLLYQLHVSNFRIMVMVALCVVISRGAYTGGAGGAAALLPSSKRGRGGKKCPEI